MNFIWSRAGSAAANRDRARTDGADGACVHCPACSSEIPLVGRLRLPQEFSVRCASCGQRSVYRSAEACGPKSGAETTRPGHIQFGKKALLPSIWAQ